VHPALERVALRPRGRPGARAGLACPRRLRLGLRGRRWRPRVFGLRPRRPPCDPSHCAVEFRHRLPPPGVADRPRGRVAPDRG
jgi:hypothetical protein